MKAITFKGKNLDQVTKVLFDKTSLNFQFDKDGTNITIILSKAVTDKPRSVELQFISDDNDPVLAPLSVTPAPRATGAKK